jgi:hypothetical protein
VEAIAFGALPLATSKALSIDSLVSTMRKYYDFKDQMSSEKII